MSPRTHRPGRIAALVLALATVGTFSQVTCAADAPAAAAPAAADAGDRIRYDSHCLTINGKDTFLYSGAFHYFRCPKPLWRDRFQKLKDAGLNGVETYVAWNWHEQQPPENVDDFSKVDMTDLSDWLKMAVDEFGFYVILRPGPYICAEWDGGGYPQWLTTKKPKGFNGMWLRSDDPEYLAWCKHWYTAVAKAALPELITHKPVGQPGVILWQIENEYNYDTHPVDVKLHQLQFLAHASRDLGIDVPLITCQTTNPRFKEDEYLHQNVIEFRNAYPGFDVKGEIRGITDLDQYQPDKPRMMTELQGGWFSRVGGTLSDQQGHDANQLTHVTLVPWEKGFTGTNYYMGFGGTNLGDWAASGLTTSYDYNAPLREPGGVGDRYLAMKAMAQVVAEHGPRLARAESESFDLIEKTEEDVSVGLRRAADGSRYLFVRSDGQHGPRHGTIRLQTKGDAAVELLVHYDLGPFGAKILYFPPNVADEHQAQWLPKAVEGPKRPDQVPAIVEITEARTAADPGPARWADVGPDQSVEDFGVFDRRFVFYRTTLPATPQPDAMLLKAVIPGEDGIVASVNGKRLAPATKHKGSSTVALPPLGDGESQVVALYENGGRANGGPGMEKLAGLHKLQVTTASASSRNLTQWRMKLVTPKTRNLPALLAPDADDTTWQTVDVDRNEGDLKAGEAAVYRTSFDLTDDELKAGPRTLSIGSIDDSGEVYVNGQKVAESHDWETPVEADVTKVLHPGRNVVVAMVNNREGSGGVTHGASLDTAASAKTLPPTQWQIGTDAAGAAGKWWDPGFDDSAWQKVALDGHRKDPAPNDAALLDWYRLPFELPAQDPHVWVPWKLRLDASGNGFLYLNGHPLGRWWEVGPQRDFYLPECWLNFGPGQKNVITVELRPTDRAEVRAAEVMPYAEMAEER